MKINVDLRPNRDLIDNDFSGYKLSLDSIPIYEKSFNNEVYAVQPCDDQYSYGHVRIFSLHNHLHVNPHTPNLAYFVDEHWNVMQVSISPMNRVENIQQVVEIPKRREHRPGDFPVSIQFAASDRAVIFDGAGSFHVAAVKKDKWVVLFTDIAFPECSIVLSTLQNEEILYILSKNISEPKFETVLQLLALDKNWQTLSHKKVQVSGNLQHAAIESSNSLIVITDGQKPPKFIPDFVEQLPPETEPKYKWTQTDHDITIIIDVKEIVEGDIAVDATDQKLIVMIKEDKIIDGELPYPVGPVTWKLKGEKVEIYIPKEDIGLEWREVVVGDIEGRQFQAASDDLEDQPFNTEGLEDVDVTSPAALFRLDVEKGHVSHEVDLSTTQYLFSSTVNPDKALAVCIRHLTDACMWQFETGPDSTWLQTHIGTFSAFGYVQASKTQRKFIAAPENLSYVAICDAFRHLYIFRQPSPIVGQLRNRSSGTHVKAIARQQLVNLDTNDEILGTRATNSLLFVLTKKRFHVLVINENSFLNE